MRLLSLHSKAEIEPLLRCNVYLHLYALGDLDDFFWPYTVWYALEDEGRLTAVLLLYLARQPPTLLALSAAPFEPLRDLLHRVSGLLPPLLYVHLMPECHAALAPAFTFESRGLHYKMALRDPSQLSTVDTAGVAPLRAADLAELRALYAASYPDAWFDPRLLDAGRFYGLREAGELVSVAALHVLSPAQRVAAPGAIATHPRCRGQGYAARVTAKMCTELLGEAEAIGLNVKADNEPAVRCYQRLGFAPVAVYEEGILYR